jgi:hypothetical protein
MNHVANFAAVTVFPTAASILAFASPAALLSDPLETLSSELNIQDGAGSQNGV